MMRPGEVWQDGKKLGTALLYRVRGVWMTGATALAFVRMAHAAHKDGVRLDVNSGWRSHAHQAALFADYKAGKRKAVVAQPGFSNHQNGRALDIETAGGSNQAFAWLTAHARRFGFKRTVQSEPWHWELHG